MLSEKILILKYNYLKINDILRLNSGNNKK